MTDVPRIGSAVVVRDGDRVLLARRASPPNLGKWVFPGGKIEPFESIREAARRELREETGLRIEVENQIGALEIIRPPEEHRIIIYSWARRLGGTAVAASDVSELRWCSKDEVAKLDLSDIVTEVARLIGWLGTTGALAA
jgi:8-oxo-dGTP diphosphatase